MFKKAVKSQSKLRLAIMGPSGSGKSMTALRLAHGLAPAGRVAVIDTERGSASLYSNLYEFDVCELESFSVENYVKSIRFAESQGYDVVVIDSLSHAWAGKDGLLEFVDNEKRKNSSNNNFNAWRNATPKHNELVEAMLQSKCHIIATMRTKTEYVQEKDERTGKTTVRKIGMQPVQRDGMEYEFTAIMDIDLDHYGVFSKSRFTDIDGKGFTKPGEEVGALWLAWLNDGAPAPQPVVAPLPEPAPNTQSHTTERAVKAIATFAEMGVTEYQLLEFVGADSVEEITAEQLGAIANAYKDIRAKKTTAAALFPTMLSEPAPEFEEAAPQGREPGEDDF